MVDLPVHYSNRNRTERGVRGGRPRGRHTERPLSALSADRGRLGVEVAGIEPASSGGLTGLLRAQLVMPLLGPTGPPSKPV